MNEVLLVGGMAAVTLAIRYPVLALVGKIDLPPLMLRALRFVPTAVLTAIIVPNVLIPDGVHFSFRWDNANLIAAIVAALVSWRTKSLLLTIIAGMASFFFWRLFITP
jgi:branched-subunit amino acid transport protein